MIFSSEKIVPFGIAVAAASVSVVGTWPLLDVDEIEAEEEVVDGDSEKERNEKAARNVLIREQVGDGVMWCGVVMCWMSCDVFLFFFL